METFQIVERLGADLGENHRPEMLKLIPQCRVWETAGERELDGRSDVYSLGCVLYEMLAGEPPFIAQTPQAIIAKGVLEPVPHVRTLRGSVPESVEAALTRALARAPADRFQTAAEFARALAVPVVSPPAAGSSATVPTPSAAATVSAPSMPSATGACRWS